MRGAKPERALESAVERSNVFRPGECVLLACSGGSDSVALASIAAALTRPLKLRLTIGHVNHATRPSAWQDEAVVLRVGAALGLPVKVAALPALAGEAALRDARYEQLGRMASDAGCSAIATGHQAEDQTETVLLALFRGTGLEGLAGMPARRALTTGVDVIRPLLRYERSALQHHVHEAHLPYAVDPTNADRRFRRNAVRAALAALRPSFPGLDGAVARAAGLVSDELDGTDASALRQVVRAALRQEDTLRDVDFAHVEEAVRALQSGRSGRFFMKAGVELTIDRGTLTVRREA